MPATFRAFAAQAAIKPEVKVFYEDTTHTVCAVVRDPSSRKAAIIDSVLGFNYYSGSTDSTHADAVADYVSSNNLEVEWILETHAHADHLSAAPYLQGKLGGKIAIGEHIREVQHVFAGIFNLGSHFKKDGSQFDHLFADGETFQIGSLEASVMHTPGHTPACICYHIGDALFAGDTIFMPDYGTARCDFPGGSSRTLYSSIRRIMALPDETRVFVGHDYLPQDGRKHFEWETTIGEQKKNNVHVGEGKSEDDFVQMRESRDKLLAVPKLLIPSVQVNICAGKLPDTDGDGNSYLSVPLNKISNKGTLSP